MGSTLFAAMKNTLTGIHFALRRFVRRLWTRKTRIEHPGRGCSSCFGGMIMECYGDCTDIVPCELCGGRIEYIPSPNHMITDSHENPAP